MEVGQVLLNVPSLKSNGKVGLNGKNISISDFSKLISGLFSGKAGKSDAKTSNDILSILLSQMLSGNTAVNSKNPDEIKNVEMNMDSLTDIISNLSLDDIKLLISKEQLTTTDNTFSAEATDENVMANENFYIPEISDKHISVKELKAKLMELASKLETKDNPKLNESVKLEDYGDFKKSVLLSRKNNLIAGKEPGIVNNEAAIKLPVKKESLSVLKDENKKTGAVKADDFSGNTFSSAVNKIEAKNNSLKLNTELPEVKKENLNQDLIKTISFMKDNEVKNLTVKVTPKELGEITIELIYSGDKISAKLTPSTSSTFQLLDQNAAALNSELSKNGINVQNVSVNLNAGNFSGNEGSQGQEYKRKEGRKQVQEIEQDEPIENPGNINIFA